MLGICNNINIFLIYIRNVSSSIHSLYPGVVHIRLNFLTGDHHSTRFNSKYIAVDSQASVETWMKAKCTLQGQDRTSRYPFSITSFQSTMFGSSSSTSSLVTCAASRLLWSVTTCWNKNIKKVKGSLCTGYVPNTLMAKGPSYAGWTVILGDIWHVSFWGTRQTPWGYRFFRPYFLCHGISHMGQKVSFPVRLILLRPA